MRIVFINLILKKPELSIYYNSNSGNGLLGMGFKLGGSSAIYRCDKTIATDGMKGGVGYDDNDRYCLDGQRLIAIRGQEGKSAWLCVLFL
jgi:hypothetical protein